MLIKNQDRNAVIEYTGKEKFRVEAAAYKDDFIGINLYLDDNLLGTFDSIVKATVEIGRIECCNDELYEVSGNHVFDSDPAFERLLKSIMQ